MWIQVLPQNQRAVGRAKLAPDSLEARIVVGPSVGIEELIVSHLGVPSELNAGFPGSDVQSTMRLTRVPRDVLRVVPGSSRLVERREARATAHVRASDHVSALTPG